jgi:hypothetical protein
MESIPNIPPDVNLGPEILASTLSVVALALVTLLLRLYVRLGITGNVGWDVSVFAFIERLSLCADLTGLHDHSRSDAGMGLLHVCKKEVNSPF